MRFWTPDYCFVYNLFISFVCGLTFLIYCFRYLAYLFFLFFFSLFCCFLSFLQHYCNEFLKWCSSFLCYWQIERYISLGPSSVWCLSKCALHPNASISYTTELIYEREPEKGNGTKKRGERDTHRKIQNEKNKEYKEKDNTLLKQKWEMLYKRTSFVWCHIELPCWIWITCNHWHNYLLLLFATRELMRASQLRLQYSYQRMYLLFYHIYYCNGLSLLAYALVAIITYACFFLCAEYVFSINRHTISISF